MLVRDTFSHYTNDEVKQKVEKFHSSMAVTPGGLTLMLRPLNVDMNKPFTDKLRNCVWIELMCSPYAQICRKPRAEIRKKAKIDVIASSALWLIHLCMNYCFLKLFCKITSKCCKITKKIR